MSYVANAPSRRTFCWPHAGALPSRWLGFRVRQDETAVGLLMELLSVLVLVYTLGKKQPLAFLCGLAVFFGVLWVPWCFIGFTMGFHEVPWAPWSHVYTPWHQRARAIFSVSPICLNLHGSDGRHSSLRGSRCPPLGTQGGCNDKKNC